MPARKNAGRSKKSPGPVPSAAPFGEPIPPSPPHFMLDDHDDDNLVTGSAGLRSGSPSPAPSEFNLAPELNRTHTDHRPQTMGTAHVISPTIASGISVMDQIAQAVRYIYPSSSQSPTRRAPSKRRPVSFNSFLGNHGANRKGNIGSLIATSLSPLLTPLNVAASSRSSRPIPELTSEDEDRDLESPAPLDLERILFSTWATLTDHSNYAKQLLILGYEQGFQIWDMTQLDSIKELVHVRDYEPFNSPVYDAALLCTSTEAQNNGSRLVVALLIGQKGHVEATFVAYCIQTHIVIFRKVVPGAIQLEVNGDVIVISTIRPPVIHVFSSRDFSELQAFSNVSSRPAFALSNRLIAFASPPPTAQDRLRYFKTPVSTRSPRSISPLGSAYKVGHGILSGMRTLGSMATAATSSRVSIPERDNTAPRMRGQNFSHSAPAAPLLGDMSPSFGSAKHGSLSPLDTPLEHMSHEGTWLTIVDLKAGPNGNEIHRFRVSGNKPVTRLQWCSKGSTLYCATSSGQTVTVFSIRPEGVVPLPVPPSPGVRTGRTRQRPLDIGVPWHLYDLHRGHSSANILNIVPSHDGLWVAACTQRGTVHIFATNPYGGPADVQSHVKGKVMNPDTMPPLSTSLLPLLRIRPSSTPMLDEDTNPIPSAMRFLSREESLDLPSYINSVSEDGRIKENFRDLLVFQPAIGILELFRITVDVLEQRTSPTLQQMGRPSRTNGSSRVQPVQSTASALTGLINKGQSLRAKDSSVASWDLRRRSSWPEVRQSIPYLGTTPGYRQRLGDNWLAYAEIDTFSKSARILPPSIYISHQFSFHSFLEDYEALLRSERFNVPTEPIHVRNEVQVSAFATDVSDAFMHADDYELRGNRHNQRNARLDDPMAAAISEELEYTQSPLISYPMLPNGASLSSNASRSLMESIPIRRGAHLAMEITGGVGEGLGKLRREIAKVRSPSMRPVPDTPTEIQELEDEELLDIDPDAASSRMTSEAEASLRTPEGGRDGRELAADPWNEWGPEDQEAVAEAERFDEIYPAGVMDEDCEEPTKRNGNGNQSPADNFNDDRRPGRKPKRNQ